MILSTEKHEKRKSLRDKDLGKLLAPAQRSCQGKNGQFFHLPR